MICPKEGEMGERKEQDALNRRITAFFKTSSAKGKLTLTTPEIAEGLRVDRRKIEPPLLLLCEGKNPKLVEARKGRVKYYTLKEVVDFCQKWMREENE